MTMAQKRQGNRFAQVQLFTDSRALQPPAEDPREVKRAKIERAMPGGRNFR